MTKYQITCLRFTAAGFFLTAAGVVVAGVTGATSVTLKDLNGTAFSLNKAHNYLCRLVFLRVFSGPNI